MKKNTCLYTLNRSTLTHNWKIVSELYLYSHLLQIFRLDRLYEGLKVKYMIDESTFKIVFNRHDFSSKNTSTLNFLKGNV